MDLKYMAIQACQIAVDEHTKDYAKVEEVFLLLKKAYRQGAEDQKPVKAQVGRALGEQAEQGEEWKCSI